MTVIRWATLFDRAGRFRNLANERAGVEMRFPLVDGVVVKHSVYVPPLGHITRVRPVWSQAPIEMMAELGDSWPGGS